MHPIFEFSSSKCSFDLSCPQCPAVLYLLKEASKNETQKQPFYNGEVVVQHNTIFLCYLDLKYIDDQYIDVQIIYRYIDDQYRNPNINNKDHLVEQFTREVKAAVSSFA